MPAASKTPADLFTAVMGSGRGGGVERDNGRLGGLLPRHGREGLLDALYGAFPHLSGAERERLSGAERYLLLSEPRMIPTRLSIEAVKQTRADIIDSLGFGGEPVWVVDLDGAPDRCLHRVRSADTGFYLATNGQSLAVLLAPSSL